MYQVSCGVCREKQLGAVPRGAGHDADAPLTVPEYEDLLGTPFVMFGRDESRDGGISCQGLVLEMYRRAGIDAPDPCDDPDADLCWDVVEGPSRPMDVIGLRVGSSDLAGHVALVLEGGAVLHATKDRGVVLTTVARLAHRIVVVYRWRR